MWSYFTFKRVTSNIKNEAMLKLPKNDSTRTIQFLMEQVTPVH